MGFLDNIARVANQPRQDNCTEAEFDDIIAQAVEDGLLGYVSPNNLPKKLRRTRTVPTRFGKAKTTKRVVEVL